MTKKETVIVLFSITLCWSSSYIFIKDLSSAFNAYASSSYIFIKDLSSAFNAYAYLTLTSGVAGIVLAVLFHRLLKKMDKKTLISGSVLALLIAGNILFEKMALDNLPASAVSALASMNIIIVPLILICRRQFPSRNVVTGIAIILVGLGISGHLQVQGAGLKGILYVFLSCLMMSLYTVFASDYTQESDPLVLTVLQLCVTALIGAGNDFLYRYHCFFLQGICLRNAHVFGKILQPGHGHDHCGNRSDRDTRACDSDPQHTGKYGTFFRKVPYGSMYYCPRRHSGRY